MSTDRDQARLIADRIVRRVNEGSTRVISNSGEDQRPKTKDQSSSTAATNGAPVSEELSAIRAGLHDLENKLDRIESKLVHAPPAMETPRARVIDFLSSGPPAPASPSVGTPPQSSSSRTFSPTVSSEQRDFVPPTQSPWLAPMSNMYGQASRATEESNPQSVSHPSQERFGVDEAAVSELVEFFENEKKCSVDPSGKPCDHCAMCSGRGF
ncbi:MAG: hypothetical protein DMF74_19055 [Acidobacteria bacterium]|nr:MAG: hypothetical protein DMF74_19055 [Acidobacteriota bacterium]